MELYNHYILIPIDEYKELQDVYQKLSETEEQRKNISQAYEDEYQTRLALQRENESIKDRFEIECLARSTFNKQNKKLREENEKLKDQIKRNLNPYTKMY